MGTVKSLKIVTKGNVTTELVNSIHKDMLYNHSEYFKKIIVRAKSLTIRLGFSMDSELANTLIDKYQSWYNAEEVLKGSCV